MIIDIGRTIYIKETFRIFNISIIHIYHRSHGACNTTTASEQPLYSIVFKEIK